MWHDCWSRTHVASQLEDGLNGTKLGNTQNTCHMVNRLTLTEIILAHSHKQTFWWEVDRTLFAGMFPVNKVRMCCWPSAALIIFWVSCFCLLSMNCCWALSLGTHALILWRGVDIYVLVCVHVFIVSILLVQMLTDRMPSTCFSKSTSHQSPSHICGSCPLTSTYIRGAPWPFP